MRKLLSADMRRLAKSRIFWLFFAAAVILSAVASIPGPLETLISGGENTHAEDAIFGLTPYIPFGIALFISLFLGEEFECGAVRNKLIVGHTRTELFVAADITCAVAAVAIFAGALFGSALTSAIFAKGFGMAPDKLVYLLLCSAICMVVISTICAAFILNIPRKSAVFLALLLFAMLFFASFIGARISEPEMTYGSVSISVDGGIEFGELKENPAYITGMKRTIYEFLYDLLPTGQSLQLVNGIYEHYTRWAPLSLALLAFVTAAGYLPFRRREFK